MLDQSFSFNNFKNIYDIENRQGKINPKFISIDYHFYLNEIKAKKKEIREYKRESENDTALIELNIDLKKLIEEKDVELEDQLLQCSQLINDDLFSFTLDSFKLKGKTVYTLQNDCAAYFAMKQLQHNVNKCFKVKQANRHQIAKQVKSILSDNSRKYIVRTDIKSFYESVPQTDLLDFIQQNQLLSPKSLKLIKNIIYQYNVHSNQTCIPPSERRGLPRGIGISAYLSELFMRSIDKHIKLIPNLVYYARYVDDIIAVFCPKKEKENNSYIDDIRKIVCDRKLELNEDKKENEEPKTVQLDCFSENKDQRFTFLGYNFALTDRKLHSVFLSTNKKNKYVARIRVSLDDYIATHTFRKNDARKLLIHRFNYLTKNVRLLKPKKGLIGIYYSNSLVLNNCICLRQLNNEMYALVDEKITADIKLNAKLKKFCFVRGFTEKLFFNISSKKTEGQRRKNIPDLHSKRNKNVNNRFNNFEKIVSVWKHEN